MAKKLTQEEFICKCKDKHKDRYDYSKTTYINSRTKVTIICKKHGEFKQLPLHHCTKGCNCPKCDDAKLVKHTKTSAQFIQDAKMVHGDKYNYSKVDYVRNDKAVTIICPIHGEFEQTPNGHTSSGYGCPKCSFTKRGADRRLSFEQIVKESAIKHNNKYEYISVDNSGNLTIVCPEHGEFIQHHGAHRTMGNGCPSCAKTGFDSNKPGILYYLSINNGQAYKIGITNKSVNERFLVRELKKIDIMHTWYYDSGKECYDREQKILKQFKDNKYTGPNLLDSGNTELFSIDILNLDMKG